MTKPAAKSFTVRHFCGASYLEQIDHVACRLCGSPYTDNSRSSVVCAACRPAYLKLRNKQRRKPRPTSN
jgi:hypothetical protein